VSAGGRGAPSLHQRIADLEAVLQRGQTRIEEAEALLDGRLAGRRSNHWRRAGRKVLWLLSAAVGALLALMVLEARGWQGQLEEARDEQLEVQWFVEQARKHVPPLADEVAELRANVTRLEWIARHEARPPQTPSEPEARLRARLGAQTTDRGAELAALEWIAIGLAACEVKELEPAIDAVEHLSGLMPKEEGGLARERDYDDLTIAERARVELMMRCMGKDVNLLSAVVRRNWAGSLD
jgi:hypothetical protein